MGVHPTVTAGVAGGVLAVVVGLAGCAAFTGNHAPKHRRTNTAQREVANTITYESLGTTTELDCDDGKSLNVYGSNNRLTILGTCKAVDIAGADNRITFDKIDKSLTITGLNNTITYREGEPAVEDRGSRNTVRRG